MLREDIPIKTCDEIKHSVKGCPTPCNDNERVEGFTIIDTYYHWQSVDPEPHGRLESWYSEHDKAEHLYYAAGSRAMFRIQDFLEELYRTGYQHKDIRHHWCEPVVAKLFPANAYIYDDRSVDIAALEDEADFLSGLIYRMKQTYSARLKAIHRYRQKLKDKIDAEALADSET